MNMNGMQPEVIRAALTMLGFGLLAVVLVTLAAVVAQKLGQRLRDGRALDVTLMATVTGKRTVMPGREEREAGAAMTRYVTFEPDGGGPIEIEVDGPAYDAIREGDHGYLTVRDRVFCGFVPEDEVARP
ncbi:MAG: DUF2500 family protein [Aristaeellaceae bacterium]